jgi:hypothetical protein
MQSVAPVRMGEVPSCMRFSCPPGVTQLSQIALKVTSEAVREAQGAPAL